jgi:hypothetical protein
VDQTLLVMTNTIALEVNGVAVTPAITKNTNLTTVRYLPANPLPTSETVRVQLVFSDSGGNTRTNAFSFTTRRTTTTLPVIQQDPSGLVVIEAENFNNVLNRGSAFWGYSTAQPGFAGPGYLQAIPEAALTRDYPDITTLSPRTDYRVNFTQTGIHYVWILGSGPDTGADSVHLGLNGAYPLSAQDIEGPSGMGFTSANWQWVGTTLQGTRYVRSVLSVPATGLLTLNLTMREDSTRIDKIILTTNDGYVPSGTGPAETRESANPPKFNAPVLQGNNLVLSWTETGTLQQAESLAGPWTDTADQSNPQTIPASGPMKFFRLRR